jgi:hypothetical protein
LIQVTSTILECRDELLWLHIAKEECDVDGVEGAIEDDTDSVSPPILEVSKSILCILCFSAASSQICQKGRIYSRKLRRICRAKERGKIGHEAGDETNQVAKGGVARCTLVSPTVEFHIDFFRPSDVFPRINDVPKRLGPLDIQKVTETKKYAKKDSYSTELKNKNKTDHLEKS